VQSRAGVEEYQALCQSGAHEIRAPLTLTSWLEPKSESLQHYCTKM
jgi:hypothetical protein